MNYFASWDTGMRVDPTLMYSIIAYLSFVLIIAQPLIQWLIGKQDDEYNIAQQWIEYWQYASTQQTEAAYEPSYQYKATQRRLWHHKRQTVSVAANVIFIVLLYLSTYHY